MLDIGQPFLACLWANCLLKVHNHAKCNDLDRINLVNKVFIVWHNKHRFLAGTRKGIGIAKHCVTEGGQLWSSGHRVELQAVTHFDLVLGMLSDNANCS